MHDSKPASRFQLPGWAPYVIGAAVVLGLAAGVVVLLGVAETRRWERYALKLRAGGDPLTFSEIEAQSSELPTEQTGAQVLSELTGRLLRTGARETHVGVLVFGRGEYFGRRDHFERDLFEGIPQHALQLTRTFLHERTALLEEIRTIGKLPPGRIVSRRDENQWDTTTQELATAYRIAGLLFADGLVRLCDGDLDGAIETGRIQARISHMIDQYPSMHGRRIQTALDAKLIDLLEGVLRVAVPTKAQLASLDSNVTERLALGTMRWAYLGERARVVSLFEGLAGGTIQPRALGIPETFLLSEVLLLKNQLRAVELVTGIINSCDDFDAMRLAAQRLDRARATVSFPYLLSRSLMSLESRDLIMHTVVTAKLRCAAAGLAAERFRMEYGRLPTSLDELTHEFLETETTDPFSGYRLRFATTDKGIVIYSVGENLLDDGGDVAQQEQELQYLDVGFRLYKPEHRSVFLTDEPRPSDN